MWLLGLTTPPKRFSEVLLAGGRGGAAQGIVTGMAFWRASPHPPLSRRTQIFVGLGMPPWDSESQGH